MHCGVDISMEFLPWELLDFSDNGDAHDIENSNKSLEKANNPLHSYNFTSQETKFGYKVKKELKPTPVKYFNQPLLNYSQNFVQILIVYFLLGLFYNK